MTKEKYKQLNDYLNRVCLDLSKDDSFFLSNLECFLIISSELSEILKTYDIKKYKKSNNMSSIELLNKTKAIISDINPEYLNMFDDIINKGILEIDYDVIDSDELLEFQDNKFSKKGNLLYMNNSFDNSFVSILNHEFLHYTNDNKLIVRYLLTEFISIYFELYSNEKLYEHGEEKIDFSTRLRFLKINSDFLDSRCDILLAFLKLGSINEDTYKDIDKYFKDITKEEYDKEVEQILNEFQYIETMCYLNNKESSYEDINESLALPYKQNYKYLFCSLLAFYSLAYKDKEDVLKLNEALRNNTTL